MACDRERLWLGVRVPCRQLRCIQDMRDRAGVVSADTQQPQVG